MTDNEDSVLPESIRDHPLLTRLRSSLLSQSPDQAWQDQAWHESVDVDPVASALALSGMQPGPPDVIE
ncbi:MAG: hypothetical protein ACKVOX_07035 [Rhizobacter sp.]